MIALDRHEGVVEALQWRTEVHGHGGGQNGHVTIGSTTSAIFSLGPHTFHFRSGAPIVLTPGDRVIAAATRSSDGLYAVEGIRNVTRSVTMAETGWAGFRLGARILIAIAAVLTLGLLIGEGWHVLPAPALLAAISLLLARVATRKHMREREIRALLC